MGVILAQKMEDEKGCGVELRKLLWTISWFTSDMPYSCIHPSERGSVLIGGRRFSKSA